jgi:nucleoside-diphosphate-sugar epimerase
LKIKAPSRGAEAMSSSPPLCIGMTGATGFIGRHTARQLLQAGHRVRALARDPQAALRVLGSAIDVVKGDLFCDEALRNLTRGADAVLHLAGAVRGTCAADFEHVNVTGTARLIEAMEARTSLIFMSSLAAREPSLSHYARSKYLTEELLRQARGERRLIILRPPPVYGPGDTEMLPLFRFMARTRRAPVAGTLAARVSLLHVADLARAAVCLLESPQRDSRSYTLHDGKIGGYCWDEICSIASGICGRSIRPWPIPPPLLNSVAACNRAAARWLGYSPMLTPEKLRELRHADWACDNDDICRDTAWTPRILLREGLQLDLDWY